MVRTQIYLTARERAALRRMSEESGRSQSDLIREAVDRFITACREGDRRALLREARGMWRDRDDLPDFASLRGEMDRSGPAGDI